MQPLLLVTAPTTTPITLTEAKAHLRVDFADDDTLITTLLSVATSRFDGPTGLLGRALMPQTWDMFFDGFPSCSYIKFPMPPLTSVTGVFYTDPSLGTEQTFASTNYEVDTYSKPGRLTLISTAVWPITKDKTNSIRVRFVAGYADAASVPAPIKAAMLLTIADLYEARETFVTGMQANEVPMSPTVDRLVNPYKVSWA